MVHRHRPAALRNLEVSGVGIGEFAPDQHRYQANATAAEATVTAQAWSDSAAVTITPADSDPAMPGHQVALGADDTKISVAVANGAHTDTYTVTVTRSAPRQAPQPLRAPAIQAPALVTGARTARGLFSRGLRGMVRGMVSRRSRRSLICATPPRRSGRLWSPSPLRA